MLKMSWFSPAFLPDIFKKKICRYLLQRYLGQFLEEKLTLEQLNVDITNGTGTVNDVNLYCQALNELCEAQEFGIEVVGGRIGSVTVTVPWNALMTEDSFIHVDHLFISIRPHVRPKDDDGTSMLESVWSSMSSSMQLAQECLEKEGGIPPSAQSNVMEGLERFAQTIDNVLNRVKARLTNTEIRLEYLAPDSDRGIALIVKIDNIEYQNQAGNDPPDKDPTNAPDDADEDDVAANSSTKQNRNKQKSFLISTYASHHITMEGITFLTEEFRVHRTTPCEKMGGCGGDKKTLINQSILSDQYYSTISTLPETDSQFYSSSTTASHATAKDCCGATTGGETTGSECDDDFDEEEVFRTEPIVIGKLLSRQNILIKMKQADNIPGPKVQLELTLGSFSLFLTPRQLHLLLRLTEVMVADDCAPPEKNGGQCPMDVDVGRGGMAAGRFNPMGGSGGGGLGFNQGWSSDNYSTEPLDSLAFLQPLNSLSDSINSTSSSMTSSIGSSAASQSTMNSRRTRRRRQIDLETNADISDYNIRVACVTVVLLHDDILMECSSATSESPLSDTSVEKLKQLSDRYFQRIGVINVGMGANDLSNAMRLMDSAVPDHHHLRLLLAPIIVEGEEQRNSNGIQLRLSTSVGRFDFREVLKQITSPLLYFPKDRKNTQIRPDFQITFNQLQRSVRDSVGRRFAPPKTDLIFSLACAQSEFDISIVDRLSGILAPSPFVSMLSTIQLNDTRTTTTAVATNRKTKTEIVIESTGLDFKLRFPIADLRPIHDPQRIPWWERNIRPDFLTLALQQLKVCVASPFDRYEITSNEINIYYSESETSAPVHLGRTKLYENTSAARFKAAVIEYPTIVLEFPSEERLARITKQEPASAQKNQNNFNGGGCRSSDEEGGPSSGESIGITTTKQNEWTPFTSKRICRESDTPHSKTNAQQQQQQADEAETLLIPGDNQEMATFCENAMRSARIQIKISLPTVSLQLNSKHLYETIYNRINSDLLMWEASAPSNSACPQQTPMATSLLNAGMMDSLYMPYTMCASRINYESSSSSTETENSDSDNDIYYSILDKQQQTKPSTNAYATTNAGAITKQDQTSTLAFRLNIGQGIVTMYAPVRDSQNHVIPGQLGEFVLRLRSTYLFSVAGFQGNPNLGYFCLQSKFGEIYHCGLLPIPLQEPPLRVISCMLPPHVQSTLYPTPKDLTQVDAKGSGDRDMISLAIQIKANPAQRRKRIRVTAGIQLATLRHHFTASAHSWLTQLTDMFDVLDYPVQGYTPYTVVTELHLHLWDCAIDYRPLHFNYRAVLTLGTFMITSNIASASSGCTLRFVAEDATFSLAPQTKRTKQRRASDDCKITALPAADLVCILDLGLFEISLRLNEKATASFPKFDLRASINDVHIRTCSDSGQALAQFIGYLAAEGDFDTSETLGDDGRTTGSSTDAQSVCLTGESDLLSMRPVNTLIPEVTQSQQQRVNTLMAEAMEESMRVVQPAGGSTVTAFGGSGGDGTTPIGDGGGVEIFFFPDETNTNAAARHTKPSKTYSNSNRKHESDELTSSVESGIEEVKKSKLKHRGLSSDFDDDSFANMFGGTGGGDDDDSGNTEMQELLDFETSVMMGGNGSGGVVKLHGDDIDDDDKEALPQVARDLGEIVMKSRPVPIARASQARKISSDSNTDDDFCIIAEEEKVEFAGKLQEVPTSEEPIRIIDNHFSVPYGKPDLLLAPKDFPMAVMRYTLCEMSLVWHIYGGHDFLTEDEKKKRPATGNTTTTDAQRYTQRYHHLPMSEAYKMGVSFSKGSPRVCIGGGVGPLEKLTWKTRGGPYRKHDVLMEFHINKVRFSHETYPSFTEQASRQVLLITELEIRDRLEVSNINKFLYHPTIGPKSKGSHHMVVLKALHLRPDPSLPTQECCLRISLLPLRLNIDQDSLEFLVTFFTELGGEPDDDENESAAGDHVIHEKLSKQVTPSHQPPVMMVEIPEAAQELQARRMVNDNLMLLMENEESEPDVGETTSEVNDLSPIYFRHIVFSPAVPIRLDYHGKRVEFNRGPMAGLIMGLGQLQCSEIKLKAISHRHGILGVDRLLNFMLQEWLQDIKRNQLPSILSGVGPMHSLVQLFQGIRDLFWLPIEQYQKDGRIVRGLQLGAQSFTARTALAALEITTRIIHLLQITAETAYDMVSPGPSVRRGRGNRKGKRKRCPPPQDIREGVATAYQIMRDGIGETGRQICEMTAAEHDQKGYTGAVGAVVRQIPPTVVRPLVLATQATSKVLGGVRNQLVPDARAEAKEKWKDDEDE